MANISGGAGVIPGIYTNTTTTPRGGAVNIGNRIAAIIGTGETEFEVVSNASGNGADGYDPTFTYLTGQDGRHFIIGSGSDIAPPYTLGLTTFYKNGNVMTGIEGSNPIPSKLHPETVIPPQYQYRFDSTNGRLVLQTSSLVDQGGSYYKFEPISNSAKLGTLQNVMLINKNAITEQWIVRCIKVQYVVTNGVRTPVAGTAQFIAVGSISNQKFDKNGNPCIWLAISSAANPPTTVPPTTYDLITGLPNPTTNNGILSFDIVEDPTSPFIPGDQFLISVNAQILSPGDSLTVRCVPQSFINDPVAYTSLTDIYKYHGRPSLTNTLSLGCQLAFENGAGAVMAVQAAPPTPIRTTINLTDSFNNMYNPAITAEYDQNDFIFSLPYNFVADLNYDLHIFDTDPDTGTQQQVLLNKYTDGFTNISLDTFIKSGSGSVISTYKNNYALIYKNATYKAGYDGAITRTGGNTLSTRFQCTFTSPSVNFDKTYEGMWVYVIDANNSNNRDHHSTGTMVASFEIKPGSVINNGITLDITNVGFRSFTNLSGGVSFQLIDDLGAVISTYTTGTGINTVIHDFPGMTDGIITDVDATITTTSGTTILTSPVLLGAITTIAAATGTKATIAQVKIISAGTTAVATGTPKVYVVDIGNTYENIGIHDAPLSGQTLASGIITLQRCFVDESNLRYEIIDPNKSAYYVAFNCMSIANGHGISINAVSRDSGNFVDSNWENALLSLEKIECDIVVPLPTSMITPIFQQTIAHCFKMSSLRNKKERVPFIGAINGLGVDNIIGQGGSTKQVAVEDLGIIEGIQGEVGGLLIGEDIRNYSVIDSYGTIDRCVYMYPDQITKTLVKTGEVATLSGYFMCPALAGYITGNQLIQEPVTNKTIVGFSIPRSKMLTPYQLEELIASGILTAVSAGSTGGRLIWGITTTQSGVPEQQELSILLIRDSISKTFRALFQRFVGTAEKATTLTDLNITLTEGVKIFTTQGWITQYRNATVQRDPVEPRQWNVGVEVQPAYGINWVYITTKVNYFTS